MWLDALLVYLSGVGYPWGGGSGNVGAVGTEGVKEGWPVGLQIIGKDILW